MAEVIDTALTLYFDGISSFWDVEVPFRHGKSDIFSRAFPGYFFGRCLAKGHDPDLMLTGYGASLVQGFSLDAKKIIQSPAYKAVFPEVVISKERDSAEEWRLHGKMGKVVATGLGGSLTGKGYHAGVCDDTCKSREEAESKVYRDGTYTSFATDFMSRRAPVSITFLIQTPWHVDGVQGRLREAQAKDPDFPKFQRRLYPARKTVVENDVPVVKYLFPERFSETWYKSQYATLGKYAAAGLLDCNPVPAEGNVGHPEWFKIWQGALPSKLQIVRSWDMAATAKKSADFTAGCKLAFASELNKYIILDYRRGQFEAGDVPHVIHDTAISDGKSVEITIEQEPAASGKIAISYLLDRLAGFAAWPVMPSGDKLTRALPLLAQAQAGNVFLFPGSWNLLFWEEIRTFPTGKNDDVVDSAAHAFNHITNAPRAGVF
jgi:predicted phage terminase large subunit-like protein